MDTATQMLAPVRAAVDAAERSLLATIRRHTAPQDDGGILSTLHDRTVVREEPQTEGDDAVIGGVRHYVARVLCTAFIEIDLDPCEWADEMMVHEHHDGRVNGLAVRWTLYRLKRTRDGGVWMLFHVTERED